MFLLRNLLNFFSYKMIMLYFLLSGFSFSILFLQKSLWRCDERKIFISLHVIQSRNSAWTNFKDKNIYKFGRNSHSLCVRLMEELENCLPELRYIYKYLKYNDRANYVKYGSPTLISCLIKIGLNLMYSNKNGLSLTPKQLNLLKKNKKNVIKLVTSQNEKVQHRCLTNKLIDVLLKIFLSVIAKLETKA